jgi:hypothetical protein
VIAYWFTGWRLVIWFLLALVAVTLIATYTLEPA